MVASKSFARRRQRPEPGEGALHNPASGDDYEASSSVGSSYDFQPPVALAFEGFLQLVTGVTAVGKDVAQSGAERANRGEDLTCPITVLDVVTCLDSSDHA